MASTAEPAIANGGSIKVGSTGTIGSLMSRELENMKISPQAASSSQRRYQTSPVSVPCGANPKKAIQRKNPPNDSGNSSSSSNGSIEHGNPGDTHKPKKSIRKNGQRVPTLRPNDVLTDRNPNADEVQKKGHAYVVEVVDLKCSNPMSNRLRKLGFSKLSESIA
ncbi:uncharacterized protein [Typha angustifolia]|uniref:uncharacterized protein n=1 Tax=Typha angustifolia TaxID=59011 RepID=UPI003C2D4B3E